MKNKLFPIIFITVILATMLSINCFAADPLFSDGGSTVTVYKSNLDNENTYMLYDLMSTKINMLPFVDYVEFVYFDDQYCIIDFVHEAGVEYFTVDLVSLSSGEEFTYVTLIDTLDFSAESCIIYYNDDFADKIYEFDLTEGETYSNDIHPVDIMIPGSEQTTILSVFSNIPGFFVSMFVALISIFWSGSSLTVLGVFSIAALAISLILLLFNLIRKFVTFGG